MCKVWDLLQRGPVNLVTSNCLSKFFIRTVLFESHLCLVIRDKPHSKQLLTYIHAYIYMLTYGQYTHTFYISFITWPRFRNYLGSHQINIQLHTVIKVLGKKKCFKLSDGITKPQWDWVPLSPKARKFLNSWELEVAWSHQATRLDPDKFSSHRGLALGVKRSPATTVPSLI